MEDEVRDRDSERKQKGTAYVNGKRNTNESKIQEGDKVSVVDKGERKLSTTYSLHLQFFRRMLIVFLLRPMVYSTVEM